MTSFKVNRRDLVGALKVIGSAVATKTTMPILSSILIKVENGRAIICGTDLDLFVESILDIENTDNTSFEFCLPFKMFQKTITSIKEPEIQISVKDCKTTISYGRSSIQIEGKDPEEFPPIPICGVGANWFVVPSAVLQDALDLVSFAMSDDQTRFILNGVLFESKNGRLNLVATDGRRLALASIYGDLESAINFIAPSQAVATISKAKGSDVARVNVDEKWAAFDFGTSKITTRLIEGEFPNYEQVIPTPEWTILANRTDVLAAIKRASLILGKEKKRVDFDIGDNKLTISSNNPEVGEFKEDLAVSSERQMQISFNPFYLMDAISRISTELLEIGLTDADSPAIIKGVGMGEYQYVLMPVRVDR